VALALGWPVFACIWVLTIGRPACNLTHWWQFSVEFSGKSLIQIFWWKILIRY
jgi:hypothetical protein